VAPAPSPVRDQNNQTHRNNQRRGDHSSRLSLSPSLTIIRQSWQKQVFDALLALLKRSEASNSRHFENQIAGLVGQFVSACGYVAP